LTVAVVADVADAVVVVVVVVVVAKDELNSSLQSSCSLWCMVRVKIVHWSHLSKS
jgi:hypothetical protein